MLTKFFSKKPTEDAKPVFKILLLGENSYDFNELMAIGRKLNKENGASGVVYPIKQKISEVLTATEVKSGKEKSVKVAGHREKKPWSKLVLTLDNVRFEITNRSDGASIMSDREPTYKNFDRILFCAQTLAEFNSYFLQLRPAASRLIILADNPLTINKIKDSIVIREGKDGKKYPAIVQQPSDFLQAQEIDSQKLELSLLLIEIYNLNCLSNILQSSSKLSVPHTLPILRGSELTQIIIDTAKLPKEIAKLIDEYDTRFIFPSGAQVEFTIEAITYQGEKENTNRFSR